MLLASYSLARTESNACILLLCLSPSVIQSRIPARDRCQSQWDSPLTSVKVIKTMPPRHAQSPLSQVILDSVKLTNNTNHGLGEQGVPAEAWSSPISVRQALLPVKAATRTQLGEGHMSLVISP